MSKYIDPKNKILGHLDRVLAIRERVTAPPVNVEIDLSNRCNLGCTGCHFAHTHTRGPLAKMYGRPEYQQGDLINAGDLITALHEMYIYGVRSVTFTGGGEPTLHPKIADIVKACKMDQGIYTNATAITPELARVLKQRMTFVYVSLDYDTPGDYATYKKTSEATFYKAIEGIRELVAAPGKATIGLGYLLSEHNRGVGNKARLGRQLGVDYVQFRPLIETDWADYKDKGRVWLRRIIPVLHAWSGVPGVNTELERFRAAYFWHGREYTACHWSKLQTVLTPNGKLWTCVNRRGYAGEEIGDIKRDTFKNIWEAWAARDTFSVDDKCRTMCRGHFPNLAVQDILNGLNTSGHGSFI